MVNNGPKAYQEIHTEVQNIIYKLYGNQQNISILDAAAGNGYFTTWCIDNGYNVLAADIDNSEWNIKGIECNAWNFEEGLQAEDNRFDLVVSIETIEHLENPFFYYHKCRLDYLISSSYVYRMCHTLPYFSMAFIKNTTRYRID